MATEVERKFLVTGDDWRRNVTGQEGLRQGYLSPSGLASGNSPETCSVRVRIQGDAAYLNIKESVMGRERLEFDYGIPLDDAVEMLERLSVGPTIEKTRYRVQEGDDLWEVDVFHGDNAGLVVAEIELSDPDEEFGRPGWLGREVTGFKRYYNVSLVSHPYGKWTQEDRLA